MDDQVHTIPLDSGDQRKIEESNSQFERTTVGASNLLENESTLASNAMISPTKSQDDITLSRTVHSDSKKQHIQVNVFRRLIDQLYIVAVIIFVLWYFALCFSLEILHNVHRHYQRHRPHASFITFIRTCTQ